MTTVLVTGANGFVGRSLCQTLIKSGYQVKAAIRQASVDDLDRSIQCLKINAIEGKTNWHDIVKNVDVVVHLAARVHVMRETVVDSLQAFRAVNAEGTENLVKQAAAAGVKRFIFISTLKVLGEHTRHNVFNADSLPAPVDAYAISKWEGEQALIHHSQFSGMEWVIIRPPLVYGPGVKGNFLRLMQLVQKEFPLPFSAIDNQRSLVFVENLSELISICVNHPAAAGQALLIADSETLSTPQLISCLANALGKKSRLWPIPVSVLKCFGNLLGKRAEIDRLCDSMHIDASETCRLFDWHPPFSAHQALAKTANSFLSEIN